MRLGKLTEEELRGFISDNAPLNEEVLIGSKIGEDCSLIKGDGLIAITTDPITITDSDAGYKAVNVCVNDIVSSGAVPFCALVTLLAPPDCSVEELKKVNDEFASTARSFGVDVIGGHTEFTDAVNRIVVSCTMLGKCADFVSSLDLRPGQALLVTDVVAKEGTGILIEEKKDLFKELHVNDFVEAYALGKKISVAKEGKILSSSDSVTAMHDITEGGVFGAVYEICTSAGVGARIFTDKIPLHPVTEKLCSIAGVNPFEMISSGSMLFATDKPDEAVFALQKEGIRSTVIGTVTQEKQVVAVYPGEDKILKY